MLLVGQHAQSQHCRPMHKVLVSRICDTWVLVGHYKCTRFQILPIHHLTFSHLPIISKAQTILTKYVGSVVRHLWFYITNPNIMHLRRLGAQQLELGLIFGHNSSCLRTNRKYESFSRLLANIQLCTDSPVYRFCVGTWIVQHDFLFCIKLLWLPKSLWCKPIRS